MNPTLGIIGLGNMGSAILSGLLEGEKRIFEDYNVFDIDKEKLSVFENKKGLSIHDSVGDLVKKSEYILLAVKPGNMKDLLEKMNDYNISNKKIITIAAGLKISFYQKILKKNVSITRVMPNTPFLVGEGAAGISFESNLKSHERNIIMSLFSTNAEVIECKEKYLDVVTGLSGSGPAYIFLVIEALADGAVYMGLNRKDSYTLAAQTVLGSAKMALKLGKHPGELKDMVTSPGGTTIEALRCLEKNKVRSSFIEAVIKATEKSKSM